MARFIRMREEGHPFSQREVTRILTEEPSRVIEVPESHAAEVIRPQGKYQEVFDATPVVRGDAEVSRKQAQRPQRKGSGSGRSSTRGSGDRS